MYYEIKGTNVRLLRSLHMVPAAHPELPSFVWNAYDWCEQIGLEHDSSSFEMRWLAVLPDSQLLEQRIPATLYARIKAVWPDTHKLGILRNQSLIMIGTGLALGHVPQCPGVETQLTQRAKTDNKTIKYLETPQEFIASAKTIDDQSFFQSFETILSKPGEGERVFHELYFAWSNYDLKALDAAISKTIFAMQSPIRIAILDRRNAEWMPKILDATKESHKILIAVGALHFVGENGLLKLLQRRGYETSLVY
jgi:uncharacterized protein YbaP (TraB family)